MDRDVRSNAPGKCPRCGMDLVAGIPEPAEFHLELAIDPDPAPVNTPIQLRFHIFDPWKHNPVLRFTTVHEKLFHAFIVSRDLAFFQHDHPALEGDAFRLTAQFPKSGMYRVLGDFYPEGATPQLLAATFFVQGSDAAPPRLVRDDTTKITENLSVSLGISPHAPIAGGTTQLRFVLEPSDGIEKYLGTWGHMLVASDDLIDMIHTHPRMADGSPELQFTVVFPRPRMYRIWVQFQRRGTVNTAHFDIPVRHASAE
jgi:hypothetical protein